MITALAFALLLVGPCPELLGQPVVHRDLPFRSDPTLTGEERDIQFAFLFELWAETGGAKEDPDLPILKISHRQVREGVEFTATIGELSATAIATWDEAAAEARGWNYSPPRKEVKRAARMQDFARVAARKIAPELECQTLALPPTQ